MKHTLKFTDISQQEAFIDLLKTIGYLGDFDFDECIDDRCITCDTENFTLSYGNPNAKNVLEFPYDVLGKVDIPVNNTKITLHDFGGTGYDAVVTEDKVVVGCKTYSREDIYKLAVELDFREGEKENVLVPQSFWVRCKSFKDFNVFWDVVHGLGWQWWKDFGKLTETPKEVWEGYYAVGPCNFTEEGEPMYQLDAINEDYLTVHEDTILLHWPKDAARITEYMNCWSPDYMKEDDSEGYYIELEGEEVFIDLVDRDISIGGGYYIEFDEVKRVYDALIKLNKEQK